MVGCREWGENRREVPKRDGLGVPARTRASERRWEPAAGLLFPVGSGRASRGRQSAGEAAVALHFRAVWARGCVVCTAGAADAGPREPRGGR
ncbi:MAG: hypothetical protein ACK524_07225, partial [Planctomyces sp.]